MSKQLDEAFRLVQETEPMTQEVYDLIELFSESAKDDEINAFSGLLEIAFLDLRQHLAV